jgi:hypothetical protein
MNANDKKASMTSKVIKGHLKNIYDRSGNVTFMLLRVL